MRTKDNILDQVRRDIQMRESETDSPLRIECRKIEVLIDIMDILKKGLDDINNTIRDVNFRD